MRGQPIGSLRFVAVSATVPNVADLAEWLGAPLAGIKCFGTLLCCCQACGAGKGRCRDPSRACCPPAPPRAPAGEEMRPVKLRTVVRGYNPPKTGGAGGGGEGGAGL